MLNTKTTLYRLCQAVAGAIGIVAVAGGLLWAGSATLGRADTKTENATAALNNLSSGGVDNSPIATVNGVPLTRTTLEIHVATADLLGLGAATRDELIQDLVDSEILRQAASAAGIEVAEEEVDAAIRAGLIEPLQDKSLPPDVRDLLEAALKAQGLTVDSAVKDVRLRSAYEGLILRGRYLLAIGKSRTEVMPDLRANSTVILFEQGSATGAKTP